MNSSQSELELDQILDRFIALAKSDSGLKAEIKSAMNQDEVIAIAHQRGFMIDSLTILRKWSQHTDFSQPTWLGWFED